MLPPPSLSLKSVVDGCVKGLKPWKTVSRTMTVRQASKSDGLLLPAAAADALLEIRGRMMR